MLKSACVEMDQGKNLSMCHSGILQKLVFFLYSGDVLHDGFLSLMLPLFIESVHYLVYMVVHSSAPECSVRTSSSVEI